MYKPILNHKLYWFVIWLGSALQSIYVLRICTERARNSRHGVHRAWSHVAVRRPVSRLSGTNMKSVSWFSSVITRPACSSWCDEALSWFIARALHLYCTPVFANKAAPQPSSQLNITSSKSSPRHFEVNTRVQIFNNNNGVNARWL